MGTPIEDLARDYVHSVDLYNAAVNAGAHTSMLVMRKRQQRTRMEASYRKLAEAVRDGELPAAVPVTAQPAC